MWTRGGGAGEVEVARIDGDAKSAFVFFSSASGRCDCCAQEREVCAMGAAPVFSRAGVGGAYKGG